MWWYQYTLLIDIKPLWGCSWGEKNGYNNHGYFTTTNWHMISFIVAENALIISKCTPKVQGIGSNSGVERSRWYTLEGASGPATVEQTFPGIFHD